MPTNDVGDGFGLNFALRPLSIIVDVEYVVAYLQEYGTATPADLREAVYPDHNGGYTDGQDPARSWWKNAMYPALAELARRTDDIQTTDHSGE